MYILNFFKHSFTHHNHRGETKSNIGVDGHKFIDYI